MVKNIGLNRHTYLSGLFRSLPTAAAGVPETGSEVSKPDLAAHGFVPGDQDALAKALAAHIGLPMSGPAVAAFLESQGWSDTDAQERFGCADLVVLGRLLWEKGWATTTGVARGDLAGHDQAEPIRRGTRLRGLYFLALALVQVTALALTGVSFGAGFGFTSAEATAVGLGMVLGLLWANSFSQLLARDPLRFHQEGRDTTAGRAVFRLLGIAGGLAAFLAAAATLVGGSRAAVLPGTLSFLLVTLFWLAVNALFVLDLAPVAVLSALAGLVVAGYARLMPAVTLTPPALAGLALTLADLLMAAALVAWWRSRRDRSAGVLPRLAGVVVGQAGYLLYGLGLMLLIVVDRLVAWRIGGGAAGLVFQGRYEAGLAWALLAFLVTLAGQEGLFAALLRRLRTYRLTLAVGDLPGRRRDVARVYWAGLGLTAGLAAVAGGLLALVLVYASDRIGWLTPLLPVEEALPVFRWALLGYGLLAVAMLNTGLLVAMSQPGRLLPSLFLAVVADLAVAWAAAQTAGYAHSVFGLIAGAALLLLVTTWQVNRLFQSSVWAFWTAS